MCYRRRVAETEADINRYCSVPMRGNQGTLSKRTQNFRRPCVEVRSPRRGATGYEAKAPVTNGRIPGLGARTAAVV